jgi:hypothetical protein
VRQLNRKKQARAGSYGYPAEDCDSVTPIADCNVTSPLYYARFLTDSSVLMNGRHCPQEVIGINGNIFLIRRNLLLAAGGLDSTQFPFLFAIPDLSFHLHQQGKKNISTPYCMAKINAEGMTRRRQWPPAMLQEEKTRFQNKWFDFLYRGDPYYNRGIISDSGLSEDVFRVWLTGPRAPANR